MRDSQTGTPIGLANVSLVGTTAFDLTPLDGTYGTGHVQSGTYSVQVSAPGYFPTTVSGVERRTGK
ncbi:MAG: carboxypeptidase regulatory-like domain-containing protein [Flavobacteriales bacterium]